MGTEAPEDCSGTSCCASLSLCCCASLSLSSSTYMLEVLEITAIHFFYLDRLKVSIDVKYPSALRRNEPGVIHLNLVRPISSLAASPASLSLWSSSMTSIFRSPERDELFGRGFPASSVAVEIHKGAGAGAGGRSSAPGRRR